MLGKLVKYEFVNRYRNVLGMYLIVFVLGVLYAGLDFLDENYDISKNSYAKVLVVSIMVMFMASVYISIAAILINSLNDYKMRFFGIQGYLTHTLPVSTFKLLIARMICDLCICASMGVFYPLMLCISNRNFFVVKRIAEYVGDLFQEENIVEQLSFAVRVIAVIVLGLLILIWLDYASNAVGHSFSSGKKAKTTIAYIILIIVFDLLITSALVNVSFYNDFSGFVNYIIFVMALCVAVLVGITNYFCKNRLNLE